jgi:phosphatidate cytidylyltransferase
MPAEAAQARWMASATISAHEGREAITDPTPAVYSHPWMKRILTALVLIPSVLVLVFLGSRWLFTLAVAGVAALAAWEFLGLAEKSGAKPPRAAVMAAVLALFAGNFEWPDETAAIFGLLSLGLVVYCTFFSDVREMLADVATAILCLVYTGMTLIALPALREDTEFNGPSLVAFLLCAIWAGDIAALYVGRSLGKHKMAPTLSPNKSWEGAVGSLAGSLAAAGILLGLSNTLAEWNIERLSFHGEAWYCWLALAALINLAAQAGDLAESAIKRSVGAKDSGTMVPGHGGVLDRIDAMILAAPALWYALTIHKLF